MLDKNNSFNTSGDFILGNGDEVERESGLAWFDKDIKETIEELHNFVADIQKEKQKANEVIKMLEAMEFEKVKQLFEATSMKLQKMFDDVNISKQNIKTVFDDTIFCLELDRKRYYGNVTKKDKDDLAKLIKKAKKRGW